MIHVTCDVCGVVGKAGEYHELAAGYSKAGFHSTYFEADVCSLGDVCKSCRKEVAELIEDLIERKKF